MRRRPLAQRVAGVALAALVLSACDPNRFVTGWIPSWGITNGRAVIDDDGAASLFAEVSLMLYGTDDDTTVDPSTSQTNIDAAVASVRAQGLPVVPSIFDGQAAGVMRGILDDPYRRAQHEQNIVNLVMSQGYDGIDLDYEVFAFGDGRAAWDSIRPDWISFVSELGSLLHARGKLLSVTVPPVWTTSTTTSGYTVYAQQEIAPHIDRLRVMVYDWSTSAPGPIAPGWWVDSVIAWSSARVPVSKLQLGVPAYGRHWATKKYADQTCPTGATYRDSITMRETAPLAASVSLEPVRDVSGELTFAWTEVVSGTVAVAAPNVATAVIIDRIGEPVTMTGLQPAVRLDPPDPPASCTVQHTVFVPDALTIRERAEGALAAGWSGIAVWAIGYETADVYELLGGVDAQRPNGVPTGSITSLTVATGAAPASATFSGTAYDPEFDLPVPVRLTVTRSGATTPALVRTVLARRSVSTVPAGIGPFHGWSTTFSLTEGTWNVCASLVQWGGSTGPGLGCRTATVPVP
ncbi:MAG: glycosyl hydrolase family 18 protein [Ilumatobacteraceae bacterium]